MSGKNKIKSREAGMTKLVYREKTPLSARTGNLSVSMTKTMTMLPRSLTYLLVLMKI